MDIDFNGMLSRARSGASRATAEFIEKYPESKVTARQMELIASVTAKVTVDLLREYHAAVSSARPCNDPSSVDTH